MLLVEMFVVEIRIVWAMESEGKIQNGMQSQQQARCEIKVSTNRLLVKRTK